MITFILDSSCTMILPTDNINESTYDKLQYKRHYATYTLVVAQPSFTCTVELNANITNSPSESEVSDSGGSLAMYWRPLSRLFSTIGRLSSSCLLKPRWSSCNAQENVHVRRRHSRPSCSSLARTLDEVSRLIREALNGNVESNGRAIDVVYISSRAFVISFDKTSSWRHASRWRSRNASG